MAAADSADLAFGPGGLDFSKPEPLPQVAQQRVLELMDSGRLFRYQGVDNDVAELERSFSEYIGLPHTLACNSGGCGLFLALKSLGVGPGVQVLVNAWTLAPVPGAIMHAGGSPVFVAMNSKTLAIDVDDLEAKARASGAKVLLLSYMRGQLPDLDKVMAVVRRLKLTLIEDCAHTLGATWHLEGEAAPRHIGSFGDAAVWSLQTNKSINSGEGGLISTPRQDVSAFITVATGSYGHYAMNGASGDLAYLDKVYTSVPNMSMRMTNIAAALAQPQMNGLKSKLQVWERHALLVRSMLSRSEHIRFVAQEPFEKGKAALVWTSIQFEMLGFNKAMIDDTITRLAKIGIPLAWFGGPAKGFTSTLRDWKFADPASAQWSERHNLITTSLVDIALFHTAPWPDEAFTKLGQHVVETIDAVAREPHAPSRL